MNHNYDCVQSENGGSPIILQIFELVATGSRNVNLEKYFSTNKAKKIIQGPSLKYDQILPEARGVL